MNNRLLPVFFIRMQSFVSPIQMILGRLVFPLHYDATF
jgi:hypothetical protein